MIPETSSLNLVNVALLSATFCSITTQGPISSRKIAWINRAKRKKEEKKMRTLVSFNHIFSILLLCLSACMPEAFVTNWEGGDVAVVDLSTGQVKGEIMVGFQPGDQDLSPDQSRARCWP